MGKKLFLIAILSIALMTPAFAAVENIKVSGDITAQSVLRDLSLGDALRNGNINDAEHAFASQTRIRFDADLTENVSAVVRLLSERLWGEDNVVDSDIDLDLAYVEMKEFLYQPLSITVGRQLLHYGNGLIVGDPDTNQMASTATPAYIGDLSLRKSFDAIKGVLDFSPFTFDMIYAQVYEGDTERKDDIRLWGMNAAYQWGSFNGITEGYYFGRQTNTDGNGNAIYDQYPENQDTTHVIGGRVQFDPIEKLMVGFEGAYQFGDVAVPTTSAGTNTLVNGDPTEYRVLSAFALQLMTEYKFMTKYDPKLGLRYTYLSGNDDTNQRETNDNGGYHAWDPMFEDQTSGELINLLFPNSNTMTIQIYGSVMPREDVTLGLTYIYSQLAENYIGDAIVYAPQRGPANWNWYQVQRNNKHLGSEIDTYMLYDYTEDVQIKMSGAFFIPGDFFQANNDQTAYSLRTGLTVNF